MAALQKLMTDQRCQLQSNEIDYVKAQIRLKPSWNHKSAQYHMVVKSKANDQVRGRAFELSAKPPVMVISHLHNEASVKKDAQMMSKGTTYSVIYFDKRFLLAWSSD